VDSVATALRFGIVRTIPADAVDKAASVVLLVRRMIRRRCVVVGDSLAGLANKAIHSPGPATLVVRDFAAAGADSAALPP